MFGKEDKMIKKLSKIFSIAIITIGMILVAIPICGNFHSQVHTSKAIVDYKDQVEQMSNNQLKQAKTAAKNFNDTGNTNYYNALDLGEIITYLDIPAINLYLPVYNNTDPETLQVGPGHLEYTSLPIGGSNTHCVITGHSGLTTNTLFTNLDKLKIGDTFSLHTLDEIFTYEVDQIKMVLPEDAAEYIQAEQNKDFVTLLTCTPTGINTHRLLIRGTRVTDNNKYIVTSTVDSIKPQSDSALNKQAYSKPSTILFTTLPLFLISVGFFIILIRNRRKNSIKDEHE